MMKLFSAIALVGASFLFATGAQAGGSLKDTTPVAEPERCVRGAFSGAYVGGHLGFGGLSSDQHVVGTPFSFSDNDRGFTIGGHSGYNVQCGRVLFGIESDFNWFDADTFSDPCGGCGPSWKSEINWFGTLRGRLGLVHNDNFLVFATAGLAYANLDRTLKDPTLGLGGFSKSHDDTEFGWTAGGGIEFMRDSQWSLRADALYVDLGSDNHSYSASCGILVCSSTTKWEDTFWVTRIGLTYHFGEREPEYIPLK
jgi:outer membrane immunogenic protein